MGVVPCPVGGGSGKKLTTCLEYTLTQAPAEQAIIRQCMREGLPLPNRIANAPELQLGLELYYDAFWELSTSRPSGFGVGPIPWLAVCEYARAYDFDEEQSVWLQQLVRVMDKTYLEHHASKEDSNKGKGKGGNSKWRPLAALGNLRKG